MKERKKGMQSTVAINTCLPHFIHKAIAWITVFFSLDARATRNAPSSIIIGCLVLSSMNVGTFSSFSMNGKIGISSINDRLLLWNVLTKFCKSSADPRTSSMAISVVTFWKWFDCLFDGKIEFNRTPTTPSLVKYSVRCCRPRKSPNPSTLESGIWLGWIS